MSVPSAAMLLHLFLLPLERSDGCLFQHSTTGPLADPTLQLCTSSVD